MGKSFSVPKAKERVDDLKTKVDGFNGTTHSKRYKKLERKLLKTNEKLLKLQGKTQQVDECKELLVEVDKLLCKLKEKATLSISTDTSGPIGSTSVETLNYENLMRIKDEPSPQNVPSKILPPIPIETKTVGRILPPVPITEITKEEGSKESSAAQKSVPGISPPGYKGD